MDNNNNHFNHSADNDNEDCYSIISEDVYKFENLTSHHLLGKVMRTRTHIVRLDQASINEEEFVIPLQKSNQVIIL